MRLLYNNYKNNWLWNYMSKNPSILLFSPYTLSVEKTGKMWLIQLHFASSWWLTILKLICFLGKYFGHERLRAINELKQRIMFCSWQKKVETCLKFYFSSFERRNKTSMLKLLAKNYERLYSKRLLACKKS